MSRVDPVTGNKNIIFTASDYFGGAAVEQSTLCFQPNIGVGTLGLALHPDFLNPSNAFVYFLYSYNSGTTQAPVTRFKVERLKWNSLTNSVIANTTLVTLLPTGYDHLGGRLMSVKQNNIPYLFVTCGDNGISETNSPTCYASQTNNPNNFAQNPNYKNGKIHRFNMDGSIPSDNPKAGYSFYTRGHRNPQGLIFNTSQNIIYDVEHGDQTDDEINILESGKNYGWKNIRGYHSDNNFPGEAVAVSSYTPDASISGDGLKEAFYAWCAVPQPTTSNGSEWCTVAPSDGIYYGGTQISEWTNSLLIVTLKNGTNSDQELYQFKLTSDGLGLETSTQSNPNPKHFFGADQALNGRLRDVAISNDGTKIYLINNGGAVRDKITVYTYDSTANAIGSINLPTELQLYPNPSENYISIKGSEIITALQLTTLTGEIIKTEKGNIKGISTIELAKGTYLLEIKTASGKRIVKKIIKE